MLSIEDTKTKTRELFGLGNDEDLEFINDEFLSVEAVAGLPEGTDDFPRIQYGSGMAYGYRNGRATYETLAGVNHPNFPNSPADGIACGGSRWWYYQDEWDHDNIDSYCGGNTHNQFYRKFKLTFRG